MDRPWSDRILKLPDALRASGNAVRRTLVETGLIRLFRAAPAANTARAERPYQRLGHNSHARRISRTYPPYSLRQYLRHIMDDCLHRIRSWLHRRGELSAAVRRPRSVCALADWLLQ